MLIMGLITGLITVSGKLNCCTDRKDTEMDSLMRFRMAALRLMGCEGRLR